MKVAITQPYFFPYLGYFKLIESVDKFVFFDDVQYIRRGWVNRNKIRIDNPLWITVPVKKTTRETPINKIQIDDDWDEVVKTHLKTFETIYGKKVKQNSLYNFYSSLSHDKSLNSMLCKTIEWVSQKLNLKTEFISSSDFASNLKSQDRIIDICKKLGATQYFNLPGGVDLYDRKSFAENDLNLNFVDTNKYSKISVIETIFNEDASNIRL